MISLNEILEGAIAKNACDAQLIPFKRAIESSNETLAWQIVLGNIIWLETYCVIDFTSDEYLKLLDLAENTGIRYYNTGEIFKMTKFGDIDTPVHYQTFFTNGKLDTSYYFNHGRLDGEYKSYFDNGKLYQICFYKNREMDGIYKIYYYSGQLSELRIYEDGNLISTKRYKQSFIKGLFCKFRHF